MHITFLHTPIPFSLKLVILALLVSTFGFHTKAQVGIGTTSPHISSILEVSSDTSGMLIPRMSAAQRDAINTPAPGLMVVCTDCNDTTLFMFFNGNWSPVNTQITDTQLQAYLDTADNGLLKDENDNVYPAFTPYSFNGSYNLLIGDNVMLPHLANASGQSSSSYNATDNTIFGNHGGESLNNANQNTLVGAGALENMTESQGNVVLGAQALQNSAGPVFSNTVVGKQAGQNSETSYSVLIGLHAGKEATNDHALYIANTETESPLIGGRFDQNKVGINKAISALGAGATLQVGGDISLAQGGDVEEFSTDKYLNDSSFTAAPTQGAVKAYMDSSSAHFARHKSTDIHLNDSSHQEIPSQAAIKAYVDNIKNTVWMKDDKYNMFSYHDTLKNVVESQGRNLAIGHNASKDLRLGHNNITIGYESFTKSSFSYEHVLIGNYSGSKSYEGSIERSYTGLGSYTLQDALDGSENSAIGSYALKGSSSSNEFFSITNTAVGSQAGRNYLGLRGILLGFAAGKNSTQKEVLYLANDSTETPLIGGDFYNKRVGINRNIKELISGATFQVAGDISLAHGADVEEFSTDIALSDSSHTAVPTEAAVKAYVDGTVRFKAILKDSQLNLYTSYYPLKDTISINRNLVLGNASTQNLVEGNDNISIGYNSLKSAAYDVSENVIIGSYAGNALISWAEQNVALGTYTLNNRQVGSGNVAVGHSALSQEDQDRVEGNTVNSTTAIGVKAGLNSFGGGHVFIGHRAGEGERSLAATLYIANDSTQTPLMGGNFDGKRVGINRSISELRTGATFQVGGDISLASGVAIDEFSTDITLSDSSHTAVPTEAAVKHYVDQQLSTGLVLEGTGNVHGNNGNFTNVTNFNEATYNTAIGYNALQALTTGDHNVAIGNQTLTATTDASYNVAVGSQVLEKVSTGASNIGMGRLTGSETTTGYQNIFVGRKAGELNTKGSNNVYLGPLAGNNNKIGVKNVMIGFNAGSAEMGSDKLYIATSNTSSPLIGGDFTTGKVGIGTTVTQLSSGKTFQVNGTASKSTAGSWVSNSDKRLKKNIRYLNSEEILETMLQMKGATYEWNDTVTGTVRPQGIQYGFIAQDIEQVWPSKIAKDGQGYLITAYGDYDPMFVEALKALNTKIEGVKSQCAALKVDEASTQQKSNSKIAELKQEMSKIHAAIDEIKQNNAGQPGTH